MNRAKIIIIIAAICILGHSGAYAEDYGATARGMFTMLPPSIFENTPEGLTETGKQELLHTGRSEFWEIAGETPDVMVLAQLPFRDRAVALRLFRNNEDGSTEVAVGTLGEQICTVELWRMDMSGRIVPADTPPEPRIDEFFRKKQRKNPGYSVLICLGMGGLSAKPVLWDKEGFVEPQTDYEISFQWTGAGFEKRVRPVEGK